MSFVFPILRTYFWVYIVCFANTLLNIFFPTWYFQGVQKMRVVSYIQLIFKLLSLPFIFIFIKKPDDILLFAIIMTASSLLGALYAFIHLLVFERLKISLVPIKHTFVYIKESQYFFYTNFLNMMKIQTINLIIGTRYSMTDLALYDLANRIVSIPLMLITNINSALFPKVVSNFNVPLIKKILMTERIIGILAVLTVVVFGKIAIQILGGEAMEGSYWIAVILSFTIFAFLQTSCYIGLILIPNRKDSYVLKDLILSFTTLFTLIVLGMLLSKNILVLPLAFSLAALAELLYLRNVSKKNINIMTLSYLLEQYKIFRSKDSLKLYNFFSIDKELNWFYYFMQHRNINKPINMFSVLGYRKLIKLIRGKKVFFFRRVFTQQ